MASLLSLYGSGGRRRQSVAPVRRLLRRLRSSFRRSTARPVRFGYDLHSYSQNFDDGVASASSSPAAMACS